jgi:hypothetical protein
MVYSQETWETLDGMDFETGTRFDWAAEVAL